MDMKCMKCGEPWDWWYIRDDILEDETLYQKAKKEGLKTEEFIFSKGPYIEECSVCIGKETAKVESDENAEARRALADVLGDDIDGFLSSCEDFGL